jgi:predicted RNase H-like nuclease (RuvC/YqgF family)
MLKQAVEAKSKQLDDTNNELKQVVLILEGKVEALAERDKLINNLDNATKENKEQIECVNNKNENINDFLELLKRENKALASEKGHIKSELEVKVETQVKLVTMKQTVIDELESKINNQAEHINEVKQVTEITEESLK